MLIQRLRDGSEGMLAKILVGLIIVVFAMFGLGSITTFLAPIPKVAVVNGEDITMVEMETAVQRNRRIMLAQDINSADIDEDLLRENVLQSLITRELLKQASGDLKLSYSDARLDEEITQTPVFQTDGAFSPQQFQLVIGGAGFSPMVYREEMRRDKIFGQLSTAIRASAFVTDSDVARAGSLSRQTRDIAYLRIEPATLFASIVVSQEELTEYYESNKRSYETEETVDIAYVELKQSDLTSEVNFLDEELEAYFAESREVYAQPERRRIAHILIETTDDDPDSGRAQIQDIHHQIIEGGDFAELARVHSNDPGSAAEGGDLGFSERGAFAKEFEDVAFSLGMNEVSDAVLTEYGYHIIKVLDIDAAVEPTLADVRDEVEPAFRESLAEDIFVSRSARLGEIAFESADLETLATELGLEIRSTGPVSRSANEDIAANREVIDAAFSADLLLDGNNSDVIEISPANHVVVHVKAHQPSELRTLEEVAEDIRAQLLQEKAAQLSERQALEMVDMLKSGSLTRYVADQYGLEWQVIAAANRQNSSLDNTIKTAAFSLPRPSEGDKSVGYTTMSDGGAAVISVTNVNNFAEGALAPTEVADLHRIMNSQQGAVDYQEFQETLAAGSDVERIQ